MSRKTLREYTVTVKTGVIEYLPVVGNGIQLRSGSVALRVQNQIIGLDSVLSTGDGVDDLEEFTELQLSHGSGVDQVFTLAVGVGGASSRSALVAGLPAEQGAYTQAAVAVTNASGLLLAANSARRTLLISNNSATGDIYLNLAGAAATVAAGHRIKAGDAMLLDRYPPAGAIYAIGSIANNPDIVVSEG